MCKWPSSMEKDVLRRVLFNTYIFIDGEGGTGGGLFRTMFARFLIEAAEITEEDRSSEIAGEFHRIADRWQKATAPSPRLLVTIAEEGHLRFAAHQRVANDSAQGVVACWQGWDRNSFGWI